MTRCTAATINAAAEAGVLSRLAKSPSAKALPCAWIPA